VLVTLFLFGQAAFWYSASGWFWATFSVSFGVLLILLFFRLSVAVEIIRMCVSCSASA
jgi:hypothetical protein